MVNGNWAVFDGWISTKKAPHEGAFFYILKTVNIEALCS
jgi:hypothetical protein